MITIAMSTVIGSARDDVWRAITDPAELIRWDEHLVELLEPSDGYPEAGREVRWRYRLGLVPVVLRERTLEVSPPRRLRTDVRLGLFHFGITQALTRESSREKRTRVSVKLTAQNAVPVVGGLLDRFSVRRVASDFLHSRLHSVQKWCENHP